MPARYSGMSPADIDPVESASSPIVLDPGIVGGSVPGRRDIAAERVARLVAAGMDPEQAVRVVAAQDQMHGGTPQRLFDADNTPAANEALAARIAAGRDFDERMGGFAASIAPPVEGPAEAQFAGREYSPSSGSRYDQPVRPRRPAPAPAAPEGGYGRTVPGPRDMSGKPVRPGREFASQEEADAYHTRPVVGTDSAGRPRYGQSQADMDMRERGFVAVQTPDGVRYMQAYDGDDGGLPGDGRQPRLPGGYGRAGARPDLAAQMTDGEEPVPVWRQGSRFDPAGNEVYVWEPTDAFREQRAAKEKAATHDRLARKAGLSPEEAADKTDDELRQIIARKNDAATADRKAAVIRRAQAQYNPMEYLNRPDVSDWNRFVMASRMLGRPVGSTPLDVEAAEAKAEGDPLKMLIAREQMDRQREQADRELPPEERAARYRDQPDVHPSEIEAADQYVSAHYSAPWGWFGTSTEFTTAERQATLDYLVNSLGYKPAKAQKIVDEVARRRISQSWEKPTTPESGPPVDPAFPAAGMSGGAL